MHIWKLLRIRDPFLFLSILVKSMKQIYITTHSHQLTCSSNHSTLGESHRLSYQSHWAACSSWPPLLPALSRNLAPQRQPPPPGSSAKGATACILYSEAGPPLVSSTFICPKTWGLQFKYQTPWIQSSCLSHHTPLTLSHKSLTIASDTWEALKRHSSLLFYF